MISSNLYDLVSSSASKSTVAERATIAHLSKSVITRLVNKIRPESVKKINMKPIPLLEMGR